jgi:hypothetical protein
MSMKSKVATGVARRLLMTVAVIALAPAAFAQSSGADGTDPQRFFVLDNPGDPNFNQLLGINDGRVIVGYFGDGTIIPNNGYVLVPRNHYSVENFTNLPSGDTASQTQAIGINTRRFPISSAFTPTMPPVLHMASWTLTGFNHLSMTRRVLPRTSQRQCKIC